MHSNCSDGTYSPAELVDYAVEKGLFAFALTDHDTVDGLDEAIARAEELRGLKAGAAAGDSARTGGLRGLSAGTAAGGFRVPDVIPGIEFSTRYREQDLHILGLAIDHRDSRFREQLQEFVDSRTVRNRKMCRLLRERGIHITCEALEEEFPDAVITRAHYAKYMLKHGYIQSIVEAFDRYIGDHCPCYIPREKVTPQQAIELILRAGGIPIFAHPVLCRMSDEHLDELTAMLKDAGLIGIEAIYGTYRPHEERAMRALAKKHGLLISGGSDFHGSNKPGLDLGSGCGNLFVPVSVWKDLCKSLPDPAHALPHDELRRDGDVHIDSSL